MATGGEITGGRADQHSGPGTAEIATVTMRWQQAESRLYPLIVADPELYEFAVTLVVEAREVLRRDCSTVAELIESDPRGVLSDCPSAAPVQDRGFDPVVAFDAARAQRLRELG